MNAPRTGVSLRWPGAERPLVVHGLMIDLDGTLANTLGDFDAALNAMLRDLALPAIDADTISRLVGKGSEKLVRSVLVSVGAAPAPDALDPALFQQAYVSYQRHYAGINGQHSVAYPGVAEGLAALSATGVPMACLTNKPRAHAETLLATLGLTRHFSQVFGGDCFARKKPDPLPLIETARALGVAPQDALMLGDSSNDSQAAHAAGSPVLLVEYGYNHGHSIHEVPALGYLRSLADLQVDTVRA